MTEVGMLIYGVAQKSEHLLLISARKLYKKVVKSFNQDVQFVRHDL